MPTRKDKTNVAPIYREQVFIPASGATLMKQKARPRFNGFPIASGAIDIVSPEFDLLTGIRGITNLPKGFLKTNKLPQGENLYYRQLDKSSKGLERAKQVGVIDTKSSGGVNFTTSRGTTLRIGKTFDTPFFAKGSLWYNNVDDMDVIVGKDNPLLDWKMITQHGRVTENAVKAANRRTPFYNGVTNQAPTELFELYRRYPGIGYRNVTNGFPTIPITGLNTAAEQMKCGGRRKAQLGLDIREGGIAIPIAPNMYYMDGRSHDNGGIAIGPNNKNGLEVEGGEVVKVGKNDVKVFSSVPLLRGVSPAQLVMGGANPNKVFKAQEDFKDRNRINDDGTTYEVGGEKIIHINNLPSSFRGQLRNGKYVQIGIPPITNKAKSWNNTFKDHVNSLNVEMKNFIMDGIKYGKQILPKPLRKYYARGINILNSPGVEGINNTAQKITQIQAMTDEKKAGGIYIKPSKRGTFTAAATKHGMGVQEFASKVLANKEDYSPAMVKKANFAKNANRWKKEYGGSMIYTINGNIKNGLMSARPKAEWGKGKNERKWRYKNDPENVIRGYSQYTPYGKIYNDGDSYLWANGVLLFKDNKEFMDEAIKYQANKRPQFYAEKRLPIAGNQSLAEKTGLARSGWSYGENPTLDYVPNINISVPINYAKAVDDNSKKSTSSTPRGRGTKASTPKVDSQSTPTIQDTVNKITMDALKASKTPKIDLSKVEMPKFDISRLESKKTKENKAKLNTSSTGGGTQSKDGRWIGQYKTTNAGDWIGLGSNVLGSLASYFITKNAINKMPSPVKPVMAQAAKLKTKYNVEPQLSEIREAEEMNRAAVRRNTQSSNTSLAREQRLMNEARGARNTLYGQKENIETQLINQDRLNRQSVMRDNVRAYNEYLNKLTATKIAQNEMGVSNINNLISGLTGSVNNILGTIESRRATNNTLRAIAAANPNVDARLIGGFDYYIDPITKKKYNKNQQYVGTING